MEVLSTSNPFQAPVSSSARSLLPCRAPAPSIVSRRTSRHSSETQRNGKAGAVSTLHDDALGTSIKHATSVALSTGEGRSTRRLTISGFLPLPSITASPVCTPSPSMSSQSFDYADAKEGSAAASRSSEEFATAPSTPCASLLQVLITPPTWISTPPTPPRTLVRRSATCLSPRSSAPLVPSASLPALAPPHVLARKRCSSLPAMSMRLRTRSEPLVKFQSTQISRGQTLSRSPLQDAKVTPRAPALRARPIFHISNEGYTDNEDNGSLTTETRERSHEETSAEGGSSDHSLDVRWHSEKSKDNIRKYHALMELLTTEVGYLIDLRALVTIYLRSLPTLVCRTSTFGRASSSFTSSPWISSYSHLHISALPSSTTLSDTPGSHSTTTTHKEPMKSVSRYLFSDTEIELLTRNADEILQLHEHFVEELQIVMAPLGYLMEAPQSAGDLELYQKDRIEKIDEAIGIVSTKFATEASRFNSYQPFCSGHPEALDLVRKVQQQHSLEWEAFEQRSATMVSELLEANGVLSDVPINHNDALQDVAPKTLPLKDRKRTSSMTSLDGATRTPGIRNGTNTKESIMFPSDLRRDKSFRRLTLTDYLIKPVQRICKYPLLLEQLKPGKSVRTLSQSHPAVRSHVDVIIESASQAMRHVATAVDEARHRQDVAMQSSLIISRITFVTPTNSNSPQPTPQMLTSSFLSSLGTCLLAGSLDVMHYHVFKPPSSTSNIKAKYLGAFLYLGGYLLLVKVSKGKIYEPKHWFSLADFEISGVEEEDAMLPCSLSLSCKGHQFELAAACQREKDAWLSSIRESLAHSPIWINEPTSSLNIDGKGELIPSVLDDGPFEAINALPTIQSIPELVNNPDGLQLTESLLTAFRADNKRTPARQEHPPPPSRRSSTASVKAIFTPMSSDSETIVIRRASTAARLQVDQGLRDVISQPCLTARSYASSREEELFQAPKITRAGYSRSSSGMSMAGMAKSRLRRHESVRVLRRKSLLDGPESTQPRRALTKTKSLASRKHSKNLSITSLSEGENSSAHAPATASSSPSPLPQISPVTSSAPSSTMHSPIRSSILLRTPPPGPRSEGNISPRNSSFLATNRKSLFHSRSSSPISFAPMGHQSAPERPAPKSSTPSLLKRWAKGSLHRRSRSAPEIPEDQLLPFPISAEPEEQNTSGNNDSTVLSNLDFGLALSLSASPEAAESHRTPIKKASSKRKSLLFLRHSEMDTTSSGKTLSLLQRLKA